MEFGAIALVVALASLLLGAYSRRDRSAEAVPVANQVRLEERRLSLGRALVHRFRRIFNSREIRWVEGIVRLRTGPPRLEVSFHCPRVLVQLDLEVPPALALAITGVEIRAGGDTLTDGFGLSYHESGALTRIRIVPHRLRPTDRIILRIGAYEGEISYDAKLRVTRGHPHDLAILTAATNAFRAARYDETLVECEAYFEHSRTNGFALALAGEASLHLNKTEEAGELLLRAALTNPGDEAFNRYRQIQEEQPWLSDDDLKQLREAGEAWTFPGEHGAVTLKRAQTYLLGLTGWFFKRHVEVLEIRRPAAARLFSSLEFELDSGEHLVFTRARRISESGESRELPLEQFSLGDSRSKNPLITVTAERTGMWIMPELSAGDIIEWTYELVCHEGRPLEEEGNYSFILASPGHSFFPSVEGSVEFRWLDDDKPAFHVALRGHHLTTSEATVRDWQTRRFELERYIPERPTGSPYHKYLASPVVTCATVEHDWRGVARSVLRHSLGDPDADVAVPEPLATIAASGATPEESLRAAFYWIRDRLKYAAIRSAQENIGKAMRAEAIIASGVGDCKDRSYLLWLVSRKLGLQAQFVFVSSEHGVVFPGIPSDQFDHVFLRVNVDGVWRYLDAANPLCVYGSPPSALQESRALAVAKEGAIITIPADEPAENRLQITETFATERDGWLDGVFHVRMEGNIARLTDENWKRQSLQHVDRNRATESVLQSFLPGLQLVTSLTVAQTFDSDTLELTGAHRRCQLARLGGLWLGTLSWQEPTLPLGRSPLADSARLFSFYSPLQVDVDTVIHGDIYRRYADCSPPVDFENEIGRVVSVIETGTDRVRIGRQITIKRKYVRGDEVKEVAPLLTHIERALQVAVSFRPEQVRPDGSDGRL